MCLEEIADGLLALAGWLLLRARRSFLPIQRIIWSRWRRRFLVIGATLAPCQYPRCADVPNVVGSADHDYAIIR
jgi:hypothetical protein